MKIKKFQNSGEIYYGQGRGGEQTYEPPNVILSEEEQTEKPSGIELFLQNGQQARDARIGAIGAQQVRDLYNSKKSDEARKLASDYLKANIVGATTGPYASKQILTYGLGNGLVRLGAGTIGGEVGSTAGKFLGEQADKTLNTKFFGPVGEIIGGLYGFGSGVKATNYLSPIRLRRMIQEIPVAFGENSPEAIAGKVPVKGRGGKIGEGTYDTGVVKAPLITSKSRIAHELGHHVSYHYPNVQKGNAMGAFTKDYNYGANDGEVERLENYADLFKTKLGYPYKGKKIDLIQRQRTIDENPSTLIEVAHPTKPLNEKLSGEEINGPNGANLDAPAVPENIGFRASFVEQPLVVKVPKKTGFAAFMERSEREKDDIVRLWNGEKYNSFNSLQRDEKGLQRFIRGANQRWK